MHNDIWIECWFEENEDAIICQYYEDLANYDTSLESYIETLYEKEIERKVQNDKS